MRILMISDVFFPRINGVSTSIATFAKQFQQQGHMVHLIAPSYEKNMVDFGTLEEGWIYRIPSRIVPLDPEDRLMSKTKIKSLLGHLYENKYDVVHIHTPFLAHYIGVRLAKKLALPVVETYHTFFEEYLFHYVPLVPKRLLRLIARKFSVSQCHQINHIIVPSQPMAEVLQQYGVRNTYTILPTGVDIRPCLADASQAFRKLHAITHEQAVLVHIGRVAYEKNIDFLLFVVACLVKQIPDLVLIIAGEGPALNQLKSLASELNIQKNVKFVGYLDRNNDLSACYQAGDIFVFSSRTETQGLVLLEAMSLGVPVVSTAEMGVKDILIEGKGALIAKEQVEDFSEKVLAVLRNPKLKIELSKQGLEYAKLWQPHEMARKMLDLYIDLQTGQTRTTKPSHAC